MLFFGRTSAMLTEFLVLFVLVKELGIMENPEMRKAQLSKAGQFGDFYLKLSTDFSCPQKSTYFLRLVPVGPSHQSYSSPLCGNIPQPLYYAVVQ